MKLRTVLTEAHGGATLRTEGDTVRDARMKQSKLALLTRGVGYSPGRLGYAELTSDGDGRTGVTVALQVDDG
jgi:hypothetical protein